MSSSAVRSPRACGTRNAQALKGLGLDTRPEVRNSAVRTLFMAMGSHGAKFPTAPLRECVWDVTLPLIATCHHLSQTSSSTELGPSEIGKDKGEALGREKGGRGFAVWVAQAGALGDWQGPRGEAPREGGEGHDARLSQRPVECGKGRWEGGRVGLGWGPQRLARTRVTAICLGVVPSLLGICEGQGSGCGAAADGHAAARRCRRCAGGKVVTLLVHHSRNTEQKQWEETLTLSLAGATKVLRALLPAVVQLDGWAAVWEQLMKVRGM